MSQHKCASIRLNQGSANPPSSRPRGYVVSARATGLLISVFLCLSQAHARTEESSPGRERPLVTVQLLYCGSHLEKPPLEKLFFRASLRNISSRSQWVLLPTVLYAAPTHARKDAGVQRIDLFTDHSRKIKLLQFSGNVHIFPYLSNTGGGFQAILLAPATEAAVPLQIEYWGRVGAALPIRGLIASQLTVEGKPVARFFRVPLASTSIVASDNLSALDSWETKDGGEASFHVKKTSDFAIADAVANRCNHAR